MKTDWEKIAIQKAADLEVAKALIKRLEDEREEHILYARSLFEQKHGDLERRVLELEAAFNGSNTMREEKEKEVEDLIAENIGLHDQVASLRSEIAAWRDFATSEIPIPLADQLTKESRVETVKAMWRRGVSLNKIQYDLWGYRGGWAYKIVIDALKSV